MNITYRNENGIMIPNLNVPDTPKTPLGIYGRMRRDYLKQNHRSIYSAMMLQGTLIAHLVEIDKTYENELIFSFQCATIIPVCKYPFIHFMEE